MMPRHHSDDRSRCEYRAPDLIPAVWSSDKETTSGRLRVYNPAIVRFRGRLLMAYRVDSGRRGSAHRRIGLCALDEQLNIVPGSVVPLLSLIHI